MNSRPTPWRARLLVAAARSHQALGWPGLLGAAILGLSALTAGSAWRDSRAAGIDATTLVPTMRPEPALTGSLVAASVLRLPTEAEMPTLLQRIERAAAAEGLGWPQAAYRYLAASDDLPASIELHCTLKGPYPRVRRFIGTVLRDMPTSTIRELRMHRASTELPEIEARLIIAIFTAGSDALPTSTPIGVRTSTGPALGASP